MVSKKNDLFVKAHYDTKMLQTRSFPVVTLREEKLLKKMKKGELCFVGGWNESFLDVTL